MKRFIWAGAALLVSGSAMAQSIDCQQFGRIANCTSSDGSSMSCQQFGQITSCNQTSPAYKPPPNTSFNQGASEFGSALGTLIGNMVRERNAKKAADAAAAAKAVQDKAAAAAEAQRQQAVGACQALDSPMSVAGKAYVSCVIAAGDRLEPSGAAPLDVLAGARGLCVQGRTALQAEAQKCDLAEVMTSVDDADGQAVIGRILSARAARNTAPAAAATPAL